MRVPAVFFSNELNCCVIVRSKAIDSETGEECIPIEWNWPDMIAAQILYGPGANIFNCGKFVHIGEL